MWEFVLLNGSKIYTNLAWKYVPYIEELQAWILENWDTEPQDEMTTELQTWEEMEQGIRQKNEENWRRFFEVADAFVENGTKQKHPIGWVLDKVDDHMDGSD